MRGCENEASVFVEGNIGTGVTDFLSKIRDRAPDTSICLPRKLYTFRSFADRHDDVLVAGLADPVKNWGAAQQIATTNYELVHRTHRCTPKFIKRSIHSSISVFGHALPTGPLDKVVLREQAKFYAKEDWALPDLWIYLKASYHTSAARFSISNVTNNYSRYLDIGFFKKMDSLYDDLMKQQLQKRRLVLVLDYNTYPLSGEDWYYRHLAKSVSDFCSEPRSAWRALFESKLGHLQCTQMLDNLDEYAPCDFIVAPNLYE